MRACRVSNIAIAQHIIFPRSSKRDQRRSMDPPCAWSLSTRVESGEAHGANDSLEGSCLAEVSPQMPPSASHQVWQWQPGYSYSALLNSTQLNPTAVKHFRHPCELHQTTPSFTKLMPIQPQLVPLGSTSCRLTPTLRRLCPMSSGSPTLQSETQSMGRDAHHGPPPSPKPLSLEAAHDTHTNHPLRFSRPHFTLDLELALYSHLVTCFPCSPSTYPTPHIPRSTRPSLRPVCSPHLLAPPIHINFCLFSLLLIFSSSSPPILSSSCRDSSWISPIVLD